MATPGFPEKPLELWIYGGFLSQGGIPKSPWVSILLSGGLTMTNIAIEKGPFLVDLPTKDGDVAQLCQFLPEGKSWSSMTWMS